MDKLLQYIQQAKIQGIAVRYHGAAAFTIEKAQRLFGQSFCRDYYQFLQQVGFLRIGQHHILGLTQRTPSIHDKESFLWATLQFRQQYFDDSCLSVLENNHNQWFVLLNHTNGKLYGFDAIEAKYKSHYRLLLQPEQETFSEYVYRRLQH